MPIDPRDPLGLDPDLTPRITLAELQRASRPAATLEPDGSLSDPIERARESIDVMGLVTRLQACALDGQTMTMTEIRAAETLLNRLMAAAVQRVDIRATVEVRDKRQAIDSMVEALLRPGAVGRTGDGKAVLNLPATVTEARLARADGRGPPTVDAAGVPVAEDAGGSDAG